MPLTKNPSEIPEFAQCDKHGEFTVRITEAGKLWFYTTECSECAHEKNLIDKARDKAHAEKIKKGIHEDKRLDAGISKRNLYKTFKEYQCTTKGQLSAKNSCERYVAEFPHSKSMIMVGGVGTGKTLLASIMIDSIVDAHVCRLIKLIDLVRILKSTWDRDNKNNEADVIEFFTNVDLLVIDEIGSQFGSDTEKLFIFDIIDGRYQNMKPTVLISNLDIDGVKDAIGERCVDRLREDGGVMIAFDWSSLRTQTT